MMKASPELKYSQATAGIWVTKGLLLPLTRNNLGSKLLFTTFRPESNPPNSILKINFVIEQLFNIMNL